MASAATSSERWVRICPIRFPVGSITTTVAFGRCARIWSARLSINVDFPDCVRPSMARWFHLSGKRTAVPQLRPTTSPGDAMTRGGRGSRSGRGIGSPACGKGGSTNPRTRGASLERGGNAVRWASCGGARATGAPAYATSGWFCCQGMLSRRVSSNADTSRRDLRFANAWVSWSRSAVANRGRFLGLISSHRHWGPPLIAVHWLSQCPSAGRARRGLGPPSHARIST